jgi:hypothetical protein
MKSADLNISLPKKWKIELDNLARAFSVEEGKTLTSADLIRLAIQEKSSLTLEKKIKRYGKKK